MRGIKWLEIHPELFNSLYGHAIGKLPYAIQEGVWVCPWGKSEDIETLLCTPQIEKIAAGGEGVIEGTHGTNIASANNSMLTTQSI